MIIGICSSLNIIYFYIVFFLNLQTLFAKQINKENLIITNISQDQRHSSFIVNFAIQMGDAVCWKSWQRHAQMPGEASEDLSDQSCWKQDHEAKTL